MPLDGVQKNMNIATDTCFQIIFTLCFNYMSYHTMYNYIKGANCINIKEIIIMRA